MLWVFPITDLIDFPGGNSGGDTPVPIPNTEVKTSGADGTAWVTAWESRTLPGIKKGKAHLNKVGLFVFSHSARAARRETQGPPLSPTCPRWHERFSTCPLTNPPPETIFVSETR